MTIINPLPYTIANGDPVDATPVQANLNQIVSNVNANAAGVAGNASQEFLVATTTNPAGAVPLAQAQSQFAPVSGSGVYAPTSGNAAQSFNVANATTATEAVALGQAQASFAALNGSASQAFSVSTAVSGSSQAPQISQIIGEGKTSYSDVTASRAANTQYTNNTGRPLWVMATLVIGSLTGPGVVNHPIYVNGAIVGYFHWVNPTSSGLTVYGTGVILVPPGSTYQISNSGWAVQSWYEY